MKTFTVNVHEYNLSKFKERIDEINKKFAKRNLPLVSYKIVEEKKIFDERLQKEFHDYYVVEVFTEFEQANISNVECTYEGVVSLVDQDEDSRVYSLDPSITSIIINDRCDCDECHKSIGRNKYIVFSKTPNPTSRKDLILLGSKCAKNYFPFDIENYFWGLQSVCDDLSDEFDEFGGSSSYRSNHISIDELVHFTMWATNNFTVYNKVDSDSESTKSIFFSLWRNDKVDNYGTRIRDVKPYCDFNAKYSVEESIEMVNKVYLDKNGFDNFSSNVCSVMFKDGEIREGIDLKFIGIAIYSFVGAKKEIDKINAYEMKKEEENKKNATSGYVGNIGDKLTKTLTFEKQFGFESAYGYCYFNLFRDDEGNVYKWSTSNSLDECVMGNKVELKFTIKDHSEYKGTKQTVITRAKVLSCVE